MATEGVSTVQSKVSTAGLARISARHPWRTVGVWLAVLAAAVFISAAMLGNTLSLETKLTNNPESERADALVTQRLGSAPPDSEIVIVRAELMTVDDPAFKAFTDQVYADLLKLGPEVVSGGTTFFESGDASLVSADRRTTLIPISMAEDGKAAIDQVHRVVDDASSGEFEVLVTGAASLDAEVTETAERDLAIGEGIGITVALVVLAIVLGAVVAAALPIVVAIIAIAVALGATTLLGQFVDLPIYVTNIITMMGLAVGIDYSLFIVSRYREERARGVARAEAIEVAGATAGRTVLISGMTVMLALLGLLLTPDSGNQAIGAGALLVVVGAMLASTTLLPAFLSLLGDKIDRVRIPFVKQPNGETVAGQGGGFWAITTRLVMGRPVVSMVVAGALLLLAASSYADIEQGEVGVSALPDSMMSKEAFMVLESEFGYGQDLPAIVVIDGDTNLPAVQAGIDRLRASIAADPAFATSTLTEHPEAGLAIVRVQLTGDPVSRAAMAAVERLRGAYAEDAFAGVPANVLVGGRTAALVEVKQVTDTYTPIVFVFVLGLSFLLLMVAFRSIVIPIKAIVMNLLSVGATYGLMVLVFQKGRGADLLGFQQVEVIQMGLPLFLFAVLFGLSMDYHVFLLSRIRERFLETGDNAEAVEYGLRSTGRLITGAALIMVAVFGGFAMGDLVAMQQFGFGLAIAVLLDATIVRCVLVPASMRLLGRWNWYLPNFLAWLPEFHVEMPATPEPIASPRTASEGVA